MRGVIKKILKEDFEWISDVPGAPDGLTIGEPLTTTNPKRAFRLKFAHGHGEGGGNWVQNWFNVSQEKTDLLVRTIKLLIMFAEAHDPYDVLDELTYLYANNGEDWFLNDYTKASLANRLKELNITDADEIREFTYDYLKDDMHDWGFLSYDSWSDDLANLVDWGVTYFDEFGVEHKVNIDTSKFK